MKREVMEKWVHALRHGNYGQTYGTLREEFEPGQHAYCVLGVLCDLYDKEQHPQESWTEGGKRYLQAIGCLPNAVRKWAELESSDPELYCKDSGGHEYISELNDSGWSFGTLADAIEGEWADL